MHFIFIPSTIEGFSVGPHVLSLAGNLILTEIPSVQTPISKGKGSFPVLFTFMVLTRVLSSIRPCLYPRSVLLVLFPLTIVGGTVGVLVTALAMGLV